MEAGDLQALERLRTLNRVIAASPALQAREQQAFARTADALAARLAAENGAPAGDVRPRVAANALVGVQRAGRVHPRRPDLADRPTSGSPPSVRRLGDDAFALLERGLGGTGEKDRAWRARPGDELRP